MAKLSAPLTCENNALLSSKSSLAMLLLGLTIVLLISMLLSISIGVAGGSIGIVWKLFDKSETLSAVEQIIFELRVPRVLAACLTGAAFALAGAVMQAISYNQLADSGLLGINAGAGFMISLSAVLFPSMGHYGNMAVAFLGAAVATIIVYGLGMGKRTQSPIRLILAGSAVAAFLTSLSQGIALTFGLAKDLAYWSAGSLSGLSWIKLAVSSPWIVGAMLGVSVLAPKLSVLSLGEDSAVGLGMNVNAVRAVGMVLVFLLAGVSVSLTGGIAFLGLMIPHIARFLVGPDYRRIVPVSMLCGAILLVLADLAARMIHAPFDTPVGALVSLIGVPFFLGLTYRRKDARL